MNKHLKTGLIVVVIITGGFLLNFYWQNLRGIKPAVQPVSEDITDLIPPYSGTEGEPQAVNRTDFPLSLPEGFEISIYAKDLPEARVIARDGQGNLWVSQTKKGSVTLLELDNGQVVSQSEIFRNLNNPHGLAIHPNDGLLLYIAEEHQISRVRLYTEGGFEKIADLPTDDGHYTRTIGFGADGRLYVSIGSTCNVCDESDPRRAAIYSMNDDGSDFREYAKGLRNSVFFAWHPSTQEMWATDNGRDLLGDDIPPDEINIVRDGANFGWPICYGKNIHDTNFDKNTYVRPPCQEPFETPSHIDLQAHSAALGLGFVPESWPAEYEDDLIVAFHGSWNRSAPTGYKLVRIVLDEKGNYASTQDFITGWLASDNSALGRPVGIFFQEDGALLVTDDLAGVIYRIIPK